MDTTNKVKRILVVDDQATARQVLSAILSDHGHVDLAEKGEEALVLVAEALADGWPYDLVCMDISMPGLVSGDKAVKCIRAHEERLQVANPVPIVMISASDNMSSFVQSLGLTGADAYLVKPFDFAQIQDVIQRYLYKNAPVRRGALRERVEKERASRTMARIKRVVEGMR